MYDIDGLFLELGPGNRVQVNQLLDLVNIASHIRQSVEDGLFCLSLALLEILGICLSSVHSPALPKEFLPVLSEHDPECAPGQLMTCKELRMLFRFDLIKLLFTLVEDDNPSEVRQHTVLTIEFFVKFIFFFRDRELK